MQQPIPVNTDHPHVALKAVAGMQRRPDGTEAFDRERHPHLMQPTRSYNCLPDHIVQATEKNMSMISDA